MIYACMETAVNPINSYKYYLLIIIMKRILK